VLEKQACKRRSEGHCQPSFEEEKSMSTTIESRIPRILEQAPDFRAKSTRGGGAGLAVETWYLAKNDLANQAK
jgi:hypothetical protein